MDNMIKITGTLLKNFVHCPREAYLYYYGINFRNELVKTGEELHTEQNEEEYIFENIKIDAIKEGKLIEFKKSFANLEGTKMQVLWYLKILKDKGLDLTARIVDLTNKKSIKVRLTKENEKMLINLITELKQVLAKNEVPKRKKTKKECKGCSFFNYCWLE